MHSGYTEATPTNPNESNYLKATGTPVNLTGETALKRKHREDGTDGKLDILQNVMIGERITITETNESAMGYSTMIIVKKDGDDYLGADIVRNGSDRTISFVVQPGMEVIFTNTMLYELPSTGGNGTYWYTISGSLFLMGAALILYRNKRKGVLR